MHIDHDCTCSNWWVLIEVLSGLILHMNSGDKGGMETPMSRGPKQFAKQWKELTITKKGLCREWGFE